nr:unnamed protein product [Callosobruchus analis]
MKTEKWKNVQTLLDYIPPVYHGFYKNMKHEYGQKKTNKKIYNTEEIENKRKKKVANMIQKTEKDKEKEIQRQSIKTILKRFKPALLEGSSPKNEKHVRNLAQVMEAEVSHTNTKIFQVISFLCSYSICASNIGKKCQTCNRKNHLECLKTAKILNVKRVTQNLPLTLNKCVIFYAP